MSDYRHNIEKRDIFEAVAKVRPVKDTDPRQHRSEPAPVPTLADDLFKLLRAIFPHEPAGKLWETVAKAIVLVADHQGVALD